MKTFKNSLLKHVLLIMLLPAVLLTSCTGKADPDSDNTASYADGEEGKTEYAEPNIDLTDIAEYTGVIFPEDSELLEVYVPKSTAEKENNGDLLDLFEAGVFAKVSVAKEQLEKLYENIESNCTVLEENSSEKFLTVGPFSADEVSNSRLSRYYVVIYHPDIEYPDDYTKEYMRIHTFLYVYECNGSYNVYLGAVKTIIRDDTTAGN
ncbi:MAG: hypothetical protein PUC29_04965 [Clostridia bacterium]|nr:hypothetical protein [Clostridia bacterium]